ncbi:MAG: hypothetical protein ACAI35_03155 [Candidatus Methylacidiphilales bacterium]|nr:hypothetical protein [Candidatus Methylacidiphilales bacterium]
MTKTQFTPGKLYLIVGSILGLTLLFPFASFLLVSGPKADDIEIERAKNRWKVHAELNEADKKLADNTGWVDEKAGIVRIPLARAFELELPLLAASKPRPGAPLVAPQPAPAQPTTQPAPGAAAPANATSPGPTPPAPQSQSSSGAQSTGNPKPAPKPAPAPAPAPTAPAPKP